MFINEDIVTYAPRKKYDYIVTISTLEHVGWDEQPREPEKVLLATMPLGYDCSVDKMVYENKTGFSEIRCLLRVSADNQWREARLEDVIDAKLGSPLSCASAIVVGYFCKNGGL